MEKIGIFGTGNIGACLATLTAGNSYSTVVVGHSEAGLARCQKMIEQNWDDLIAADKAVERNKEAATALLSISNDPCTLADCTFVFEATAEEHQVKAAVYPVLEQVCPANTIIASTSSSMTAQELSALMKKKDRFIIAHPFQPAHIQPLVEVLGCEETTNEVIERTKALLEALDRQVVILKKDVPGLIVNRLAQTMFREALYMIEAGITTAADIDKAVKWAVGKRYASIGLLEYFDYVGYQLEYSIAANVYPDLCTAQSPQETVTSGLASGATGYAAGTGLYDWSGRDKEDFRKRRINPFLNTMNWKMPN